MKGYQIKYQIFKIYRTIAGNYLENTGTINESSYDHFLTKTVINIKTYHYCSIVAHLCVSG